MYLGLLQNDAKQVVGQAFHAGGMVSAALAGGRIARDAVSYGPADGKVEIEDGIANGAALKTAVLNHYMWRAVATERRHEGGSRLQDLLRRHASIPAASIEMEAVAALKATEHQLDRGQPYQSATRLGRHADLGLLRTLTTDHWGVLHGLLTTAQGGCPVAFTSPLNDDAGGRQFADAEGENNPIVFAENLGFGESPTPFQAKLEAAFQHLKKEALEYAKGSTVSTVREMRLRFLNMSAWTLQHVAASFRGGNLNEAAVVLFLQVLTAERDNLPTFLRVSHAEDIAAMPWYRGKDLDTPEVSGRINGRKPTAAWHACVDAVRVSYEAGTPPVDAGVRVVWNQLLALKQTLIAKQTSSYAGVDMVHILPLLDLAIKDVAAATNEATAKGKVAAIFSGLVKPRDRFTRATNPIVAGIEACVPAEQVAGLWGERTWNKAALHLNTEAYGGALTATALDDAATAPFQLALKAWHDMLTRCQAKDVATWTPQGGRAMAAQRQAEFAQLTALSNILDNDLARLTTPVADPDDNPGFNAEALIQFKANMASLLSKWAVKAENRFLSTEDLVQAAKSDMDAVLPIVTALAECAETLKARHQAQVDVAALVTEFNGLLLNPAVTRDQIMTLQGRIPPAPAAGQGVVGGDGEPEPAAVPAPAPTPAAEPAAEPAVPPAFQGVEGAAGQHPQQQAALQAAMASSAVASADASAGVHNGQ